MIVYNLGLVKQAILANAIQDSDLELDTVTGQGIDYTAEPCVAVLAASRSLGDLRNAEHIVVTRKGDGDGAGNQDHWVITRGAAGTVAQDWPAGTLILGLWSPEHLNQIYTHIYGISVILCLTIGRGVPSVLRGDQTGLDFFAVTATDPTPNMYVRVELGAGFAVPKIIYKFEPTIVGPFTAPTTSQRIDLVQVNTETDVIGIKAGTEGGAAPDPDEACIPLATVTLQTSSTSITSGMITDIRTFA